MYDKLAMKPRHRSNVVEKRRSALKLWTSGIGTFWRRRLCVLAVRRARCHTRLSVHPPQNTTFTYRLRIGYNTVWCELCECNEQTHSRQCCNLLIPWRVIAGVWYIVAAGLAGSASADQSTVSVHVVVVTSARGCCVSWPGMDLANFVWSFLIYRRKMKLKTVLTKQIDFCTLSEVRT